MEVIIQNWIAVLSFVLFIALCFATEFIARKKAKTDVAAGEGDKSAMKKLETAARVFGVLASALLFIYLVIIGAGMEVILPFMLAVALAALI